MYPNLNGPHENDSGNFAACARGSPPSAETSASEEDAEDAPGEPSPEGVGVGGDPDVSDDEEEVSDDDSEEEVLDSDSSDDEEEDSVAASATGGGRILRRRFAGCSTSPRARGRTLFSNSLHGCGLAFAAASSAKAATGSLKNFL